MGWAGVAAAGISAAGTLLSASSGEAAARAQTEEANYARRLALSYAAPTGAEIQQLQTASQLQAQNISRTNQLLESADPAMIELGKQTLSMLQGSSEVGSNKYLREDIADQRERLEQSLAKQFGSGYASSSLALQSLNDFDRRANSALQNANQAQINSNLGFISPISAIGQSNNIAGASSLAGLYGNIQGRLTSAALGTQALPYQSAGSNLVGQGILAGGLSAMGNKALGYFASQPSNFQQSSEFQFGAPVNNSAWGASNQRGMQA